MVGMSGVGGDGCGAGFRGLAVAGEFCAEGDAGLGDFAGGGKRPAVGRVAEDCGADYRAGGAAGNAGGGKDSAAAAGQGILFEEPQQPGISREQYAGASAAEGL